MTAEVLALMLPGLSAGFPKAAGQLSSVAYENAMRSRSGRLRSSRPLCARQHGPGPKEVHAHLIGDLLEVRLGSVLTVVEQQLVTTLPGEKGRDL